VIGYIDYSRASDTTSSGQSLVSFCCVMNSCDQIVL
jgi:hypothetical protein